jgi:high-affinity iron transporter
MRDVSPSLMFRIISVGVQGTAMTPWSRVLSPDERWAVVGYLNSLRATDGDRAYGDSLLVRYCERCGSTAVPQARRFAWQVERSDAQIAAALASDDSATGVRGAGGLAAADLDRMVAALRATTVVEATVAQARAAREDRSDPRAAARRVTRLVDDALAAARAGRAADAGDLAFDAYIAFEPLETNARMRRPGLVADLERSFAEFKGALKAGDLAAAEAQRNRIEAGLPAILELSTPTSTLWGAFLQSFVIIVREGFEAILVIGAMAAFLMKTGNRRRLRDVWAGSAVGLVLSGVLAVLLRTALAAAPASREIIEGATLLVAVAVLFSVSYWLLSKVEAARWQKFIRDKVNSALSHGGGFALAFVAFLAVFREGAETALFYQALFAAGERVVAPVTAGLVAGSAALALIFALFYRFGVRIPLRPFFAVTSGLLYYMALVFAGKGIRELQEGNAVPQTLIPGFPHVDLVGLYPTVETLAAQGVLLGLLLFALWRALRPLAPEAVPADEPADIPAEVAGRLAELQVTARRLQERVATLEQEVERHRD